MARKGAGVGHASTMKVHGVLANLDVWIGESYLNAEWSKMGLE